MKKIYMATALLLCISCALCGCSLFTAKITDNEIRDEMNELKEEMNEIFPQPSDAKVNEDEIIAALSEHLTAFDEMVSESFGAEINDKNYYFAAYYEKAPEDFGELDENTLLLDSSGIYNLPANYVSDPLAIMYFKVTNYKTEDEIEDRYKKYMDEDVFEELLEMNFEEYKDEVYLVRGGKGYGAVSIDKQSAEISAKTGNTYVVKVDKLLFGEHNGEFYLNVTKDVDGYIIESYKESFVGTTDPAKTDKTVE